MRSLKGGRSGQGARELAGWTQASLLSVGSSLRSAGSSLVTGIKAGYGQLTLDHSDKERVLFVKFGRLEFLQHYRSETSCAVLLLGYEQGFQLWSLKDTVREIASRRDGPVRCLEPIPLPSDKDQPQCPFLATWPLVAVVSDGPDGVVPRNADDLLITYVKLYSLQTHSYIHSIAVPGHVLSVSCNRRVLLVAMSTQIMAYDLGTMEMSYSAITYPAPSLKQLDDKSLTATTVPLALGPRWLAHASNQAVQSASGIAVAQPLTNANLRGSPMANNYEAVQHYATLAAKTSGKHIKTLGEAGYKYISSQVESWRSSNGASVPSSPSSTSGPQLDDSDIVGTVVVRDMVSRNTLVHFRAHTSPLLLLRFDGSGTLLVTVSVHGHTVNIFHIAPGGGAPGSAGTAAHLFRLSRGMTPATIQDVGFSCDGQWLCVSSARGTTHVFRLSAAGQGESTPPHLAAASIPPSERKHLKPCKLLAAGRARIGGFLNGGMPGSAAASAAVNLYTGSSGTGAVASTFLPRMGDASSSEQAEQGAALHEDLYVASSDGLVVRHRLSAALQQPLPPPAMAPSAPECPVSREWREDGSAELAVEAVEQWDVCRRRSWPEREEVVLDSSESSGEDGEVSQHQSWSAYAETSLPSSSSTSLPLWADSQFHILEMQTGGREDGCSDTRSDADQPGVSSTILRVEEVPTKRVNMQGRGGLAPVIIEGAETAVLRGASLRAPQGPQE